MISLRHNNNNRSQPHIIVAIFRDRQIHQIPIILNQTQRCEYDRRHLVVTASQQNTLTPWVNEIKEAHQENIEVDAHRKHHILRR